MIRLQKKLILDNSLLRLIKINLNLKIILMYNLNNKSFQIIR